MWYGCIGWDEVFCGISIKDLATTTRAQVKNDGMTEANPGIKTQQTPLPL